MDGVLQIGGDTLLPVISRERIEARVLELQADIRDVLGGEPLVVVCVLKGAFMFFSQLVKDLGVPVELEFVRLASYGAGTSPGKELVFSKDLETPIKGKNVLIVEDIVDTGRSMDFLIRTFEQRGPKRLLTASLIDKVERRELELAVDFQGFRLEKGFLVGCGMDYGEKYRELGAIYELEQA
jgi:hypoxanthine phosphoribosyltransferase